MMGIDETRQGKQNALCSRATFPCQVRASAENEAFRHEVGPLAFVWSLAHSGIPQHLPRSACIGGTCMTFWDFSSIA
jgi:hypothetical protein